MAFSSDLIFHPKLVVILALQNELKEVQDGPGKDKVIEVVARHFADQTKTKNGVRIELGLLLRGITEGSEKLKKEGVDFEEMDMNVPNIRLVLDQKSVGYLQLRLIRGLFNSSFYESKS
jgi:hypothetical protein